MAIDLCQYELKAKSCPQAILADVFLSLLRVAQEYVTAGVIPTARIEAALERLTNPVEIKAVVKRKAPVKKKAVTAKPAAASTVVYTPFFWVPTQGPAPTMSDLRPELLPLTCREGAHYLGLEVTDLQIACEAPASSVYQIPLPATDIDQIYQATKVFLKTWFLKVTREKGSSDQTKANVPKGALLTTQRASMLSSNYAQRFGILIFSLKKACGPTSTIEDVKNRILSCSLGANEVGLLSESLQNPHENDELRSSLESIEKFIIAKSFDELYDDEKFLHFIARIPNVKERMCCLYVAATFKSVAEQLITRMGEIRTALNLLVLNPRIYKLHQLVLSVGNELNFGHAVRSDLKYFRLSTFDKLVDLRGIDGMSLAVYLSHFMERLCENTEEQKFLNKVALYGVLNTYVATKDLINTYMCLAGVHKNSKLIPKNSQEYANDQYQRTTEIAAEDLLPDVQALVQEYCDFVACYTAAAYFFGDPNSVLPLDNTTSRAADDDGGSARDLLQRYLAVAEVLKPPKRRQFELLKEAELRAIMESQADKAIPSKSTTTKGAVDKALTPVRHPPKQGEPAAASRIPAMAEPKTATRLNVAVTTTYVFACTTIPHPTHFSSFRSINENSQPAQKRAKVNLEGPFAPAVIRPGGPSARRLISLRGKMSSRGVAPRAPLVMPGADEGRARVSISNSYSLARDLNSPAQGD